MIFENKINICEIFNLLSELFNFCFISFSYLVLMELHKSMEPSFLYQKHLRFSAFIPWKKHELINMVWILLKLIKDWWITRNINQNLFVDWFSCLRDKFVKRLSLKSLYSITNVILAQLIDPLNSMLLFPPFLVSKRDYE
jgi:hypothetical protein